MIRDFPKIDSPFIREGGVMKDEINPGYEWVFEDGVKAVDKLDGTNISIKIKDAQIVEVFNRTNPIALYGISKNTWSVLIQEGLTNAIKKGWLTHLEDGIHYGELIGKNINSNRHGLDNHLWVPFNYLLESCSWRSWEENKYPKTWEAIEEWFRELPSLFNKKLGLPDIKAEGLVFYGKTKQGKWQYSKLRRDMYSWCKESHKRNGKNN